ncbi:DegV family protein with EDD domain [Crossiella equi]|uniref:DegV family protein with EDD domain n=1 Tax=Crossiella equi TaxID=130796 RepID=A0ABS5AJZ4_9PSEU|nr:DegV family protein [Crossiella equi]MBP2476896.1 DegV family protein with EDD domain [Crossiella equi]
MYRRVAVVTDSTACLPPGLAERLNISVVQLQLQVGERLSDEAYLPPDEVAAAMREQAQVTTSPPPSAAFFWTYQEAAAKGAQAIVSLHLSGALSETVNAAREAATQARIPVHVVDSLSCGMSLGYGALAAAEAARSGADAEQVRALAKFRCHHASEFIYVDTLEYLRKGGRIGAASAVIGTALNIKPVLTLDRGKIVPFTKARGTDRALERVVEAAVSRAGDRPVDVAVEHFGSPERAQELLGQLQRKVPYGREFLLTQVSSIIGAHVGPGALGVTISPLR